MGYRKAESTDAPPVSEIAKLISTGAPAQPGPEPMNVESLSDAASLIKAGSDAVQGVRWSIKRISSKLGPLT